MTTVNQPSAMPTNKLSAAAIVSIFMELSRVIVSANWPQYYDYGLWAAVTPVAIMVVGYYFVKDKANV